MSDEDDIEKTEEPSHKKLEDAREKGQVPSSKEVNHWVIFLAATIFLLGPVSYTHLTLPTIYSV